MDRETVLYQGVIQPPLQAGRAGTDLGGDEGQRIKALRRGTQWFHPAGHIPPVTSVREAEQGSVLRRVGSNIINRKAAGHMVV